jgi:hypothetical protein
MIRSAPSCFGGEHAEQADRAVTDDGDVLPGCASAATAPNQPVPSTSEAVSSDGTRSASGTSGVATRVPSARGTRKYWAWAPLAPTNSRWMQLVW